MWAIPCTYRGYHFAGNCQNCAFYHEYLVYFGLQFSICILILGGEAISGSPRGLDFSLAGTSIGAFEVPSFHVRLHDGRFCHQRGFIRTRFVVYPHHTSGTGTSVLGVGHCDALYKEMGNIVQVTDVLQPIY